MRQLNFIAPRTFEWVEVPEPKIEDSGDAIVRPIAAGTCDLDAHVAAGRVPLPGPFPFGHECVAEVIEVGPGVPDDLVGALVSVPFQISCGDCDRCSVGITSACRAVARGSAYGLGQIGRDWPAGFLADLVRVPFAAQMLVPVPESVDPVAVASCSDNIPDAWRTVVPHLNNRPGSSVLIVGGAGESVPFYAIDIALALGAERVDYLDTDSRRLEKASRLGANAVEGPPPRKAGSYPITIDGSADPAGLHCAIRSTDASGVCTSLGIYFQNEVPLPLLEMYTAGITFITSRVDARPPMPRIIELVAAGRIHPERVTDQVVAWDDAPSALSELATKTIFVR